MARRGSVVLMVVLAGLLLGCAGGVPGETTAGWLLQRDVQMMLGNPVVVNTEVVGIEGNVVTERWTVDKDGEQVEWIVVFTPNPPGTDFSLTKAKKD